MSTTDSIITQGTLVYWGTDLIGELYSVNGFSAPKTKINIGSFADTILKTRPGKKNSGTTTLGINMNPDDTSQIQLEADKFNDVEKTLKLVLPEGTLKYLRADARIMGMNPQGANNDIWKTEFTFKLVSTLLIAAS